jgi:hypothetical protein
MPYIIKVLEQVAPYTDRMIVTLSMKSDDGTREALYDFMRRNAKVILSQEKVEKLADLTDIRNEQIRLSDTEWVMHLDDDDYWPREQLELCLKELDRDPNILAYSVSPCQLLDSEYYDNSEYWNRKSYSKFQRRDGLRVEKPYPSDVPTDKNGRPLYWKTNPQVKKLPYFFYHLSAVKGYSFRKDIEFAKYIPKCEPVKTKLDKPVNFLC